MYRIESIIEFPFYMPFKKEVLGLEYNITIASQSCTLAFPRLSDDFLNENEETPSNRNLKPPHNADIKLFPSEKDEWGEYYDRNRNALVKKCSIWFFSDSINPTISNQISTKTNEYIKQFILFLELVSKQAIDSIYSLITTLENDILFRTWDNNGKIILTSDGMGYAKCYFYGDDFFLTKQQVENALLLSNTSLTPPIPYLFLRDAYHHVSSYEYRKSVLDASTAVEITLTSMIQEKLKENGVSHHKLLNSMLKKYHSLSGRIELASILDIPLPVNKKEYDFMATVRNRAIHAGYLSNHIEAKKLIGIANQTVEHFFKLI